ncbi:Crp/Fnr family transcriptional regulator [Chryseobacterium indologenes]|uniref:Crp/Fnr family transcriptional regulator n=2 Tax=Chryseobacterium indologenes TaxID=253 RepID=A0AAD0YWZ9_CHRID|nr:MULTISPECIES: Crp/Fnr family transcriptional regulator [Chryseobacterium]ASE62799.1 Crp/Fnr family transcriptional regulator [Chryseobacterium indologenes]ATN06622.1 Crp/Fnr family transcriptional regulator [Chryseobacterium indologenes]AYY84617.1 Crp/Fnr family transcriptional regulator [Chryseobacterium indologenes]AYZ34302.1 Crp/Fnr family transcriptional regulator [Chryseobacterium indologenes]AZB18498.1 Crp/Fnr family transcriptional regulator [Chryseobacterium indologenes]
MLNNKFVVNKFGFLGPDFLPELEKHAVMIDIKAKTEIIREGQKNKYVPFLTKGSIKVFTLNDGRELVYYFIKTNDSCLMTFSSIFTDYISRVYAIAEEDSEALLIPVSVMHDWLIRFPEINKLFYREYDRRFSEVMNMVNDAVFHRLDKRVLNYIKQQIITTGNNPIKITHREIANSLGTSREVVSRVLKKIENEGEIFQTKEGLKLPVNENVRLI